MSSDEVDKKNEEEMKDNESSAEENETNGDAKEEKVNNKKAPKKKAAEAPKIKQPAKKRVKTEQAEKESEKEEKKKPNKQEDEESEEDEEEAGENHKAVPLLDQPLEVSGSRKRKEVQRFTPKAPEDDEKKEIVIPKGKGKSLGEIEIVEAGIARAKPEDAKLLHRLCFGKPGKQAVLKKNLRKFNGWEFEEGSDDFENKKTNARNSFKKVTVAHLKNICIILDIERSGTKDDILDRILSYLVSPVDSGKTVSKGRTKRKGALSKNYDEGDETFSKRDKKKTAKPVKKGKDDSENSENEEEESDKEESEKEEEVKKNDKKNANSKEESEPEEEEIEEEEKPKKGAKKGKKAAEKKAPPKKRGAAKKVVEKADSEEAGEGDNESEGDEPDAKKSKTPPTDEEIKTYVKELLDGANLELITMKKVCQDVYAHYPEFDLSSKKEFIKSTVKNLISS